MLFWKVLGETLFRRLRQFERALSEPLPPATPPPGVIVAELAPDQWRELLAFSPRTEAEEIRRRFRGGERCFIAREEGRIVHSRWAVAGRAWCEALGGEIPLAPGAAYIYECLTAREMRGRGIGPAVDIFSLHALRDAGFRTAVLVVDPDNRSGLRAVEKTSYRQAGGFALLRLGPWRRVIHWN